MLGTPASKHEANVRTQRRDQARGGKQQVEPLVMFERARIQHHRRGSANPELGANRATRSLYRRIAGAGRVLDQDHGNRGVDASDRLLELRTDDDDHA